MVKKKSVSKKTRNIAKKGASSKRTSSASSKESFDSSLYIVAIVAIVGIVFMITLFSGRMSYTSYSSNSPAVDYSVVESSNSNNEDGTLAGQAIRASLNKKSTSTRSSIRTPYTYVGSPYSLYDNSSNASLIDCYDSDGKNPLIAGWGAAFYMTGNSSYTEYFNVSYVDDKISSFYIEEFFCDGYEPYYQKVRCNYGYSYKYVTLMNGSYVRSYYCNRESQY